MQPVHAREAFFARPSFTPTRCRLRALRAVCQSLALLLFGSTVTFLRYRQPHRSAPAGNLWRGVGGTVISSPTPSCILHPASCSPSAGRWTLVAAFISNRLRVRSRRKRLKSRREREHSNYCRSPPLCVVTAREMAAIVCLPTTCR